MPIKVLLVEDSDSMRKAIASLLGSHPDIELVGEATNFHQAIQLVDTVRPHVVVLDLLMHDRVAPDTVKSSLTGTQVLAISFADNEEARALAENFGAVKFLDKVNLANELIPAIKACFSDC